MYNIEFTRFKLRDMDSQTVLFEISKPPDSEIPDDLPPNATRFVQYQFPPEFLQLKTVGATYVDVCMSVYHVCVSCVWSIFCMHM